MTTHQLAALFDSLRTGLGSSLKSEATKAFEEAAETFRELPDQPVKQLLSTVRKAMLAPTSANVNGKAKRTVDPKALAERIRVARTGAEPFEPLIPDVESLNDAQLKTVLAEFGQKGTTGKPKNLERVRQLLIISQNGRTNGVHGHTAVVADSNLIEHAVELFYELKEDPKATIFDIRTKLEPIRHYSKAVVEEISRLVGYTPGETREKTFERLLQNLEGIKMNQLRAKMIFS